MKRFVLVIDREGVSISLPRGKRLAVWWAAKRRARHGICDIYAQRPNWLER